MTTFSETITTHRKRQERRIDDVAGHAGMEPGRLWQLEHALDEPEPEEVMGLVGALGIEHERMRFIRWK